MKNKIILFTLSTLLLLTLSVSGLAQLKLGVIGGISTSDIPGEELIILNQNDLDAFKLSANEANYGFHFGIFLRGEIGNFYIEPTLVFNSNSIDYKLEEIAGDQTIQSVKNESYQYLDMPLIFGLRYGILRIGAGPVGHVFIDSSSELFDVSGYKQKFDQMTWGWQANLGLDVWMIRLDLRYEGNFSKTGEHFEFFNHKYQFDKSPTRWIASVGVTF